MSTDPKTQHPQHDSAHGEVASGFLDRLIPASIIAATMGGYDLLKKNVSDYVGKHVDALQYGLKHHQERLKPKSGPAEETVSEGWNNFWKKFREDYNIMRERTDNAKLAPDPRKPAPAAKPAVAAEVEAKAAQQVGSKFGTRLIKNTGRVAIAMDATAAFAGILQNDDDAVGRHMTSGVLGTVFYSAANLAPAEIRPVARLGLYGVGSIAGQPLHDHVDIVAEYSDKGANAINNSAFGEYVRNGVVGRSLIAFSDWAGDLLSGEHHDHAHPLAAPQTPAKPKPAQAPGSPTVRSNQQGDRPVA